MTLRSRRLGLLSRFQALALLLGWFFLQVVLSGVTTAWLIIRGRSRARPGLVRMPMEGLDEVGATILGCMLTLTPGSTTVDVDLEEQEILLHLLDASRAEAVVSRARDHFEAPLQRLFPIREGV